MFPTGINLTENFLIIAKFARNISPLEVLLECEVT